MSSNLAIPLEEIPLRLRCSMCSNLAQDAYRLPCCEQSICGNCQSTLPTVCKICDHAPLNADECKIHSSLRTTVTIFLRTAEKKYGLLKAKKEITPAPQTPVEKPADAPSATKLPEATIEASLPAETDRATTTEPTEDKDNIKPEEQNGLAAAENGQNGGADAPQGQQGQGGGSDMNNNGTNGAFWNNQQGINQFPDQSGQYQNYNMGWNGYDQASGFGMQGGWGDGMQNMMDQTGNMNSFNGMQSFPDSYNGMGNGNSGMGYSGYGQGSFGNSGMGIQGQGNWGNGWNMQNGMDGANFNSSGINTGFYPGAGGYNHQSYGNHQSQQNHMMPHQQFQSRGYHHNQYRNYSNQNMRGGNYGQQQQFGGPPRGNNRSYDSQTQQLPTGNDASNPHGVNGNGHEKTSIVTGGGEQAIPSFDSRGRGESSEKVLVDEVSIEKPENNTQTSMTSETDGATNAISSIDIKGDSVDKLNPESADASGSVVKDQYQNFAVGQNSSGDVEQQQQHAVPGVIGAPTGPKAMRERGERGRGRGRGGFYGGLGRGGYLQTQISGRNLPVATYPPITPETAPSHRRAKTAQQLVLRATTIAHQDGNLEPMKSSIRLSNREKTTMNRTNGIEDGVGPDLVPEHESTDIIEASHAREAPVHGLAGPVLGKDPVPDLKTVSATVTVIEKRIEIEKRTGETRIPVEPTVAAIRVHHTDIAEIDLEVAAEIGKIPKIATKLMRLN
ncbi:hypothetical protein ABW20_dc0104137 [Dactylellina cionopaga]|nr:hypothetical protein ABW20_dc0104137 [Dactylellina cionopaga]